MCENQRATFAQVKIEEGGGIETYLTWCLKRRTAVLALIATFLTVVLGMLSVRAAIIDGIRGVARQEFKEELSVFHTVAKPDIVKMVDEKIRLESVQIELRSVEKVGEIKAQLAGLNANVEQLQAQGVHQTELLEELLRRR
jgi:hypothetical protein